MSKTVLSVDDSPSVRNVITMQLTSQGLTVIEARDGQEAVDMLNKHSIDLIISDVNMPVMDGLEFLKHVKSLEKYKFTPIVMLTTEAGLDKINIAKKMGASGWIVKPFKSKTLIDTVRKLIVF